MTLDPDKFPERPAWTEIDLDRLRRVQRMAVLKEECHGHGALDVSRLVLEEGGWNLGLSTPEEATRRRG